MTINKQKKIIKYKYHIGDLEFKTKSACQKYVQNIVNNLGLCIINKTHQQYNFFINLLNNHPESIDKIGIGIDYFYIISNTMNKNCYGTMIKRLDGSDIDFSWRYCCEFKERTIMYDLANAMRQAISKDIITYKRTNNLICSLCQTKNELYENYHVDHNTISFAELKDTFLKLTNNKIPTTFDMCKIYYVTLFEVSDHIFEKEWIDYHNENCTLQILCSRCNLKKH